MKTSIFSLILFLFLFIRPQSAYSQLELSRIEIKTDQGCKYVDFTSTESASIRKQVPASWKGNCKDGFISGEGVLTFENGQVEEGSFIAGVKYGLFKIRFPDGDFEECNFATNLRNGISQIQKKDGQRLTIAFRNGVAQSYTISTENALQANSNINPKVTSSVSKDQPIGYKSSPARQDGGVWDLRRTANSSNNSIYLSRPDQSIYETIQTSDAREVVSIADRIGNAANVHPVLLLRESSELNAGASFFQDGTPYILINKKIWDLIKNDPDMAAALIGHETAHLYFHHPGATATTDAIGSVLGVLAGVALENVAQKKLGVANVGMQAGSLIGTAFSTSFTRDQEREADRQGIIWAKQNGYDPMGAVRLFQVLEAQGGNSLVPFFQTHPNPAERIENARRTAMSY